METKTNLKSLHINIPPKVQPQCLCHRRVAAPWGEVKYCHRNQQSTTETLKRIDAKV